jgi:hypothetical protein
MAGRFTAAVGQWVLQSEQRLSAVLKESVQRLVTEVQTPIGSGGNMPVDTGFLRASFQLSIDALPVGPSMNPGKVAVDYNEGDVTTTLINWQLGDTLYGGWTANYAVYMEAYYGFARRAMQNWPVIVKKVAVEARARANGR